MLHPSDPVSTEVHVLISVFLTYTCDQNLKPPNKSTQYGTIVAKTFKVVLGITNRICGRYSE